MPIPPVNNAALRGSARPVAPTRQAVLPTSPTVAQTSTHPALVGLVAGNHSMADFNAAAMRIVNQIQRPPGADRAGHEVPMDRRG